MLDVEVYLNELEGRVRATAGDALVGTYVHGSIVLGGFDPDRSDVDVIVVVHATLADAAKLALVGAISEASLPGAGGGLELSVVTCASARNPVVAPAYLLHIATRENRVVEDRGDGDPDLVLHYFVCRTCGRGIGAAPAPTAVFGEVPRVLVARQLRAELAWGLRTPGVPPQYVVLNACRAWYYLETGNPVSKIEGGEWARDRVEDRALIASALARQHGDDAAVELDAARVPAFVTAISQKLHSVG